MPLAGVSWVPMGLMSRPAVSLAPPAMRVPVSVMLLTAPRPVAPGSPATPPPWTPMRCAAAASAGGWTLRTACQASAALGAARKRNTRQLQGSRAQGQPYQPSPLAAVVSLGIAAPRMVSCWLREFTKELNARVRAHNPGCSLRCQLRRSPCGVAKALAARVFWSAVQSLTGANQQEQRQREQS